MICHLSAVAAAAPAVLFEESSTAVVNNKVARKKKKKKKKSTETVSRHCYQKDIESEINSDRVKSVPARAGTTTATATTKPLTDVPLVRIE